MYPLEIDNVVRIANNKSQLALKGEEKKERAKKEARYIEDTERLATEIEILKVVLYLVNRNRDNDSSSS